MAVEGVCMICKNCGGSLQVKDGIYVCDSCGSQFALTDIFENIEAFIYYVEYDEAGRRTKDSVIAQDIFKRLESNNINTFYNRISADGITGDELDRTLNSAMIIAKVVVMVATSKNNFESLLEKNKELLEGKTIIPVFADMNISDIPNEISSIQALDYNKVAASADLVNSILNALGRDKETDFVAISQKVDLEKRKKRKKIAIIVSIICIIICIIGIAVGYSMSDKGRYNKAMAHIENSEYADAIDILYDIQGYEDSEKQLEFLYQQYAGYYNDDKNDVAIHLQFSGIQSVTAEISKTIDDKSVRLSESAKINANNIKADYVDSENNSGTLSIKLENDGIELLIETKVKNSEITFDDSKVKFPLNQKTDEPLRKQLDKESLIGYLRQPTTLSDISQAGYELEIQKAELGDPITYRIKDTDIYLWVSYADIETLKKIENASTDESANLPYKEDPLILGIEAPVSLVAPEIIGESSEAFVEDDILFVPSEIKTISWDYYGQIDLNDGVISSNDSISFTSREILKDEEFDARVDYFCNGGMENFIEESNNIPEFFTEEEYNLPEEDDGFGEPNVFCPECGYGFFTTGVGNEGFTCPECGARWLP